MDGRRTVTAVTLVVLTALLVVGAVVGVRALFAPVDDGTGAAPAPTPSCEPSLKKGEVVRSRDVTVSVFNAGNRPGLAARTRAQLTERGFLAGDVGNAPARFQVRFVRVLAPSKDDPAARLVARQFGRKTRIQVSGKDLGAGVDVIVGNDFAGLVKAPRKVRAASAGSGC